MMGFATPSALVLMLAVFGANSLSDNQNYNSSDLSYLSNGIQFPVEPSDLHGSVAGENLRTAEMDWLHGLYDHLKWQKNLKALDEGKCREEMTVYILELLNGTSWATKMYDSSGRYSSGFFYGNDYWLGSQVACTELANAETNSAVPPFPTYFYVAKVRININKKLTPVTRQLNVGQCIPKSCDIAEIRTLLTQEQNFGASLTVVGVRPVPGSYSLWTDTKVHILGGVTIVVVAIITVASLVDILIYSKKSNKVKDDAESENNNNNNNSAATKHGSKEMVLSKDDHKKNERQSLPLRLLLAFSAVKNGGKIISVSGTKDSVRCIHGIRFFSIAWIILVHTYLEIFSIADNKSMRILTERTFMYQTISNATFSVDTFFFISGFLLTLTYFRTDSRKDKTNKEENSLQIFNTNLGKFSIMIVYRFLRLTPPYLFVLGVNEVILRYLHNYSVFSPAIIDHISCSNFWWRNALYINNFYPQHEFCMLWSWYIANDTQFFVIASALLLIAVRGPRHLKFAAISIAVLLVASWITTFTIAMKYNFVARVEEPFALFDQLYDKPWMRIGPYLIGLVAGYFMFKVDCKVKMSPVAVILGWTLSLLCLGCLVYGLGREGLVVPASAFYAALGHTAWGLSLAWITIACCSGYGGPLNCFFSCNLFLPLSRLTYCAYLIHPVLMCLTSFILDGTMHLHNMFAAVIYCGNVVLSFLVAFAISLGFEAPVVNLLKIIL
ncbi:unnamed protein product [Brassicogethes aeneus]|uniref:Nose resistant-to-fluoxetine protein N-terminal domain-containing protein n=1 Tax=Brassicogethes aeneus TaxID=1431903 RepID=A0A9P0BBF8_BRAAE|nr:unnamed protein product [Brassicogethes aeneus]